MGRNVVIISKVIGTVSLGILAGSSVNSLVAVLPAVEQATDGGYIASSTLSRVYLQTKRLMAKVSVTAFSSLSLAFLAANSSGRHPYLLYSALSLPVVSLIQAVYGPYQSKTIASYKAFNGSFTEYLLETFRKVKAYVVGIKTGAKPAESSTGGGISLEDHTADSDNTPRTPRTPALSGYDGSVPVPEQHKRSPSSDTEIVELNDGYSQLSSDSSSSESQSIAAAEFRREYALSRKVGLVSALIYSLAFGISTVGIYGDM